MVGNSFSGQDIAMELLQVAKEVHLSSKSLDICEGLSKVISKHDSLHLHLEVNNRLIKFHGLLCEAKYTFNHGLIIVASY